MVHQLVRETADLSTTLRSGRDDKGNGGDITQADAVNEITKNLTLSSRPKRSVVEGPAVLPALHQRRHIQQEFRSSAVERSAVLAAFSYE
jgi:hypothetical protein